MRRSSLLVAVASLAATGTLSAQHTGPGELTFLTDVTGPAITTGDQVGPLFADPGPVRTMVCPVAWGIRTAADVTVARLQAAELRPALLPGPAIRTEAQQTVHDLLTATGRGAPAEANMLAALAREDNRQASRAARGLVSETRGLMNVVQRIDPLRPGAVGPTRISRAVGAYNRFVDASSPAFLSSLPEELTALHAVLNALVIASLEHEDRAADPRVVDERGLACAIPFIPVVEEEPVPEPVERAIEICIYYQNQFRIVPALYRPERGDTVALVNGERRPFQEVYAGADRFASPEWLVLGDPVTIGTVEYTPFGVARAVQPNELRLAGDVSGAEFFVMPGERVPPSVVYFPIASACVVQPYRAVETLRPRG